MKYLCILAFFLTVPLAAFSQDIKTEINSDWILCGSSAVLFKSDTITLYCDITYPYAQKCCNVLQIKFSKHGKLGISDATRCGEPGVVTTFSEVNKYRLLKTGNSWILVLIAGKSHLRYLVVSLQKQKVAKYPFEVKILKILKS